MHYMFIHAMLAAAAPTADVWLTLHGPRIELWLPWPCVRHTSATKTSAIDYHAFHSCTMTAQLTRASAGSWIVIPPGGAALAPELIGRRCRRTGTRRHVGMRQLHMHPHIFDMHDVLDMLRRLCRLFHAGPQVHIQVAVELAVNVGAV